MKEINAIISAYNKTKTSGAPAALATLVRLEGSSYRRLGARMLVFDDGRYVGGISGGCLEGDALRRAQKTMLQHKASTVTYDTTRSDGHQIGIGLGCNGIIDVLFSPLSHDDRHNPVSILSTVAESRQLQIMVTITAAATRPDLLGKSLLFEDEAAFSRQFFVPEIAPQVLNDIRHCIIAKHSATCVYDDGIAVFVEAILPQTHVVIYGGHQDVLSLVHVASELGWKTTVVMNLLKADKNLFAKAGRLVDRHTTENLVTDPYCAIVLMAHDFKTDFENLKNLISSPAFYIGLLGPKNRTEKMFRAFEETGISLPEECFKKIFSPAGLDIGATTPEEIALAIAAEIKSCTAGRNGMHLRERKGTIYGN